MNLPLDPIPIQRRSGVPPIDKSDRTHRQDRRLRKKFDDEEQEEQESQEEEQEEGHPLSSKSQTAMKKAVSSMIKKEKS